VGNPVVKYTTTDGSASGSGAMTYTVHDAKTLELTTPPGMPPEKLTINSITMEKLVLSGGPWKFDKTEFTKLK
jgi:hypothetical protein